MPVDCSGLPSAAILALGLARTLVTWAPAALAGLAAFLLADRALVRRLPSRAHENRRRLAGLGPVLAGVVAFGLALAVTAPLVQALGCR